MRVQNRDECLELAGTEARLESFDGLRRERDFRHEDDGALALFERVGKGLQVNFGFAGACHSMKKKCSRRYFVGGTGVAPVKFGVPPNFVMSRAIRVGGC